MIKLTINNNSSKRTKDRIKQHTNLILVEKGIPVCFNIECILVKDIVTQWLGWIPMNEINILEQSI